VVAGDGKWIDLRIESERGVSTLRDRGRRRGGTATDDDFHEATSRSGRPTAGQIAFVSAVFPEFSEKPFKRNADELNKKKVDDAREEQGARRASSPACSTGIGHVG